MSDRPNVRTMSRTRTVCVASYRRTASSVANVSSEFTRQAPPPSLTAAALFRLFYIEHRFLSSREQTGIELACDRISIFCWQDLARGVFRGGHMCPLPQSSIEWIFYGKNRLCWDCFLYQKYSVDLKYAKNALAAASDPAGGAHDAPPDPLVGWRGGHPLSNPHPSPRLWRLDSRAFGAQLLCSPPM